MAVDYAKVEQLRKNLHWELFLALDACHMGLAPPAISERIAAAKHLADQLEHETSIDRIMEG